MNFIQIYNTNRKKIINLLLVVFVLIIADQTCKLITQKYLENAKDIVIIPDFLSLHFLRNEIIHFYQYVIYFVLSLIIFPLFILYAYSKTYPKLILAGCALLWSAVISNNIIDVFMLGYIRDFINLHGVAVGNVADQYRNAGLLLLIAGAVIKDESPVTGKTKIKLIAALIVVLALTILFWRYFARYMAI